MSLLGFLPYDRTSSYHPKTGQCPVASVFLDTTESICVPSAGVLAQDSEVMLYKADKAALLTLSVHCGQEQVFSDKGLLYQRNSVSMSGSGDMATSFSAQT